MKAAVLLLAFGLATSVASAAPTPQSELENSAAHMSASVDAHAALKAAFAEAYLRYPRLPQGVLEAQAFVASRWQHRVPEAPYAGHHGMPQSYGVMGLYRGQPGFADQVGEAAKLLGVEPRVVAVELRSNVLGAAALLDSTLGARSKIGRVEEIAESLRSLSGILPAKDSASGYARASHAFDLLLTLDRGHDDDGIRIAPKAIEFERAFDVDTLVKMRAPFVRLDLDNNRIEIDGLRLDPISETLVDDSAKAVAKSTDYGPALWQASPNYSARNASVTHVTIHTTQGSYAGALSWLTNPASQVSAHYLIRSSDGQVAQMVRESSKAWHVGNHNPYTLGIEHEGWVDQTGWYTTAMYSASSALTRHFCARYAIPCSSAYTGAATSGVSVQPSSLRIKGHQHYSSQSHTDPGRYWDWPRYAALINPGAPAPTPSVTVLDNFESSEGRFNTAPAYSGSSVGISSASTAERTTAVKRNGVASQHITLLDNSATSANWQVRHLSASGAPASNAKLNKAGGRVGFWAYTGATGVTLAMAVDDSDGTERSTARSLPANQWTYVEWKLDDAAQWNAWVGGNGTISAAQVTLDAIWIYRAQTSYTVHLYIDDVQYRFEG